MASDRRGGHNRYKVNVDFFKSWTPEMAYVLGYIYADGAIIDARSSSRTQYLSITSKESSILQKIRYLLESSKPLQRRPSQKLKHANGKTYQNSPSYTLRIGNRVIFRDLEKLGLTPRKSLTITFPRVPENLVGHFIRGYFDGDGSIVSSLPKGKKTLRWRIFFSSGSLVFLGQLAKILTKHTGVKEKETYQNQKTFTLVYGKSDALKILEFIYAGTRSKVFLERKHSRYLRLVGENPQPLSKINGGLS